MTIADCRIIELPKIADPRGNLTVIEGDRHVPFDIKRIFYVYDIPVGSMRGGHAHRELQQFFVAMSGTFEMVVDDGTDKKTFKLDRNHVGLYVPRMNWGELVNFSEGCVCCVLASDRYEESDYIREYEEFKRCVADAKTGR